MSTTLLLLTLALRPCPDSPNCSCVGFFADVLLEEYWGHHEGANLTPEVKNNVASKVFHIRHFIAYMAAGRSDLASLTFLNQTNRMGSWLNSLTQAKINKTIIHQYLKNIVHFLDYLAETPPPTCQLSKLVLVGIRREARAMLKLFRRKEVVPEVAFKQAEQDQLIPKAMLKECLSCAKRMIPEILGKFLPPLIYKTVAFPKHF